jgi:hypothetical protein
MAESHCVPPEVVSARSGALATYASFYARRVRPLKPSNRNLPVTRYKLAKLRAFDFVIENVSRFR